MIDHSQCDHPRTKAARAACRRREQTSFKDDLQWVVDLALDLMSQYDLLTEGWRFEWDRAKRRYGSCSSYHKRITLSRELASLETAENIRNTIMHEIAHALVGSSHKHDAVWKAMAIQLGVTPRSKRMGASVVPAYTLTCSNCGTTGKRHRIRRNLACRKCCNAYNNGMWDSRFVFQVEKTG